MVTNCIKVISNTQIDNDKDIDVIMSMYNLIDYIDNYSKTSENGWQYYRDEPSLNDDGIINNFLSNSASFCFKQHYNFLCELCSI